MKAQAVFIVEPGRAEIREVEISDPKPDEVQIECVANGICMGEVTHFRGQEVHRWPLPRIVGHEGIGVVTKVGADVEGYEEGDYAVCRAWTSASNCRVDNAPKFTRPPDDPAVYLAEPVDCVAGALYSYDITPGDRVLLIGAGYMGLLNVQGLAAYPLAELVVADLKPRNLELARSFGATKVIQSGTPEGDAQLGAYRDDPFDLVVEAAGAPATLQMAGGLVRTGGRLGMFAWHHAPVAVDFSTWHMSGLTVLNSSPFITIDRNINYMERAVRLMEKGVFDQSELVTHRHQVRDVQQAMELSNDRPADYIKGVLLFDEW